MYLGVNSMHGCTMQCLYLFTAYILKPMLLNFLDRQLEKYIQLLLIYYEYKMLKENIVCTPAGINA